MKSKIKEPSFRAPLITDSALAEIGMTLADLASECSCSVDVLRKYRRRRADPRAHGPGPQAARGEDLGRPLAQRRRK
jgi:hypothetical protein